MTNRQRGRWAAVGRLVRPHWARLSGLSLMSTLGALAEAGFLVTVTYSALAYAEGKEAILVAGVNLSNRSALALSGALIALRLAAALIGVGLSTRVTSEVITDLRLRLSRSYLETPWAIQQSEPAGRLQQLLVAYTQRAVSSISAVASAVVAALSLAALLGVAIVASPTASLMVLVVLGALGAVLSPLRKVVNRLSSTASARELGFANDIADLSKVNLEIETFGVREKVIAHLRGTIGTNKAILRRVDSFVQSNTPLYMSLAYVVVLVGMVIVTAMEIGDVSALSAVLLVTLRSLGYGQQLQVSATIIAESEPVIESLETAIERYRESPHPTGSTPLEEIGAIEVENLCFSYHKRVTTLDDISFVIEPGEVIGIIGPSGCGKTTLVHLLLGLREPTSGTVRVSGHSLGSIDRDSWASLVGFVPQDAALISGTLEENIRFFREIDDQRVRRAVHAAHLEEDISAMPEGLSTRIGSGAGQLSGGQRQRLAIARALVLEPRLLILDEPTASLDAGVELHIRATLSQLGGDVTVIVVAHRLSTLEECDRIMVIDDGRLVAFDRPVVLAEENPFFQSAVRNTNTS